MKLVVNPPIMPMLAKRVDELPEGDDWIFEPKWDGFRALVFRDGDEVLIQSRDEKPLNRYFPELVDPLRSTLPERCVLDGEMVIAKNDGLDFDALAAAIASSGVAGEASLADRFPRRSSSSICFARATAIFVLNPSTLGDVNLNRCLRLSSHRSI